MSLGGLGNAYYSLGQYQEAIGFYQQFLEIKREIGNRLVEGITWFNLGIALEKENRKLDAIGAFRNSRQLFQSMELDANVQMAENEIQRIEANSATPSHSNRNWLKNATNFLWRVVRAQFRQRG